MIHNIALIMTLSVIWLIPAGVVARLALQRGRSFALFMAIALFIPWPIVLFVVLMLPRTQGVPGHGGGV